MVFGLSLPSIAQMNGSGSPLMAAAGDPPPLPFDIAVPSPELDTTGINVNAPATGIPPGRMANPPSIDGVTPIVETVDDAPTVPVRLDSVPETGRFLPESMYIHDSVSATRLALPPDTARMDSAARRAFANRGPKKTRNFLEEKISGSNEDSLVYDLRTNMVYMFGKGNVDYQDKTLNGDYKEVNLTNKQIHSYGVMDTLTNMPTRLEFVDKGQSYTMDTITYNLETGKAKIKGLATQEGDGFLVAEEIKKMPDNTMMVGRGKYTTCDHIDHPHWYFQMTKAKFISSPKKKAIVGPTYFVMEDVPVPFMGVPFGFFPMTTGRNSGFIIPSYGEEQSRGFFLRNGGYYFAFNDYIDVTLTGGIYTLGSWEANVQSRYIKRYKYSGSLSARYMKSVTGDKGSSDYVNTNVYNLQWTHRQDPKFRPNSTFSSSVNFSSSTYNKYGSTNLNDYLSTQTNSSIAYSKTWPGKPYSFSTNMQHSQNSRDSTISISFPNVVFNVSRIYPFKSKISVGGKDKWYEKISLSYTGNLTNSIPSIKQDQLFKGDLLDKMNNGVRHSIPVSMSFNMLQYLNFTPSVRYNESWAFRSINKEWSDTENRLKSDTTYGFYRQYDYSASGSFSTKIYGQFDFLGKNPMVKSVRHVMTPTMSFTYAPDFTDPKFGFRTPYQADSTGTIAYHNKTQDGAFPMSARGASASISFGLSQTLEMKVRSKADTTGVKKIKIIDNLTLGGSYNFLAESYKLSTIGWSIRSSITKGFGLNVSGTLDPYYVDANGRRIDRIMWQDGKLGRITSASTSFGYTFNSGQGDGGPSVNDVNSGMPVDNNIPGNNAFFENNGQQLDPATRRAMMVSRYYDFSIPWNFSFNYGISYQNSGVRKDILQTLSCNGSVTLTEKWGVSFTSGYDFEAKMLTPTSIAINRDLHCWQMSFSWIPTGFMKSWSFNIHIKSSILQDLKYDKSSSHYDNIYY